VIIFNFKYYSFELTNSFATSTIVCLHSSSLKCLLKISRNLITSSIVSFAFLFISFIRILGNKRMNLFIFGFCASMFVGYLWYICRKKQHVRSIWDFYWKKVRPIQIIYLIYYFKLPSLQSSHNMSKFIT
jgi:hypothetical protein